MNFQPQYEAIYNRNVENVVEMHEFDEMISFKCSVKVPIPRKN